MLNASPKGWAIQYLLVIAGTAAEGLCNESTNKRINE